MTCVTQKTRAFLNRVTVEEMLKPIDLDDRAVFLLKDKYHHFSMDIDTILFCLHFAEEHAVIPPLPKRWWLKAERK
ncbi:MAG: hypothetical protein GX799_01120 [Crenarchaeota archaeon]|jgi:hypothetical protein|nr:hypothetical protein [Thermoproteota archaeon]